MAAEFGGCPFVPRRLPLGGRWDHAANSVPPPAVQLLLLFLLLRLREHRRAGLVGRLELLKRQAERSVRSRQEREGADQIVLACKHAQIILVVDVKNLVLEVLTADAKRLLRDL